MSEASSLSVASWNTPANHSLFVCGGIFSSRRFFSFSQNCTAGQTLNSATTGMLTVTCRQSFPVGMATAGQCRLDLSTDRRSQSAETVRLKYSVDLSTKSRLQSRLKHFRTFLKKFSVRSSEKFSLEEGVTQCLFAIFRGFSGSKPHSGLQQRISIRNPSTIFKERLRNSLKCQFKASSSRISLQSFNGR